MLVIGMGLRCTVIALLLCFLLQAQKKDADSGSEQPNPAAAAPEAPPFVTCPAGATLGALRLSVRSGGRHLPFRTINHLSEGDTLLYAPVLRGKEKRRGQVALVLIPAKRQPGQDDILVTEPKPANKPQEWAINATISVAALVYGPAGLNRRKVRNFLSQDEVLIAQLADYADKTEQAQQLIATLSDVESSSASVNAVLNGFASQYGVAVQINRDSPPSVQAATVFAAMNPQLSAYNPLASSTPQRVGQTASLATMVGSLFFGSPVGLAAGGTAMLLDLRAMAFPDTQFRAAFAQPLAGSPSGVNVCGEQAPAPPHTRVAYLWANRVPNIPEPAIEIGRAAYIPAAQKSPVPVQVPETAWKYLTRVREWALTDDRQKKTRIPVVTLANQKSLELDLTKVKLPPGDYTLTGSWDWTSVKAVGALHVLAMSDFREARVDPASQDRLLAGSGNVAVRLTGADFEFTTEVELHEPNDEFAIPEAIPFRLPKGLRQGPQDHLDVQIATHSLDPGSYELLISQQDRNKHPMRFKILPNPPKIENLPIIVNQGSVPQHFVLKGERLGLITKLEASGALLKLDAAAKNASERGITIELRSSPQPGTALPVEAYIEDRSKPATLSGALEITGPLPVIASFRLSLPRQIGIALRGNEFPAGYTLNALMDVKNIDRDCALRLACGDGVGPRATLHLGEQAAGYSLQQLSPDQLFLAFETKGLPAGCSLQAVIDNGREGASRPSTLARILRVPGIDSFVTPDPPAESGTRQYQITGRNLELIEKLGWDEDNGLEVSGLPVPLPGPGLSQSIEVTLPDPPFPGALVYMWLRGDKQARGTNIKAPSLPKVATEITITSSLNPSFVGQAITLRADLSPAEATGSIGFMQGQTSLGTANLASGRASLTTSGLAAGSLPVVAVYAGDATYSAGTSSKLIQTINKGTTATLLTSASNPSSEGQTVTFTAVVSVTSPNAGGATGTVIFSGGDKTLGLGTLDAAGVATFSTSALKAGQYTVTALYRGSSALAGSASDSVTHVVQ